MNTRKIIAVCLISGAALAISHSSSAQIRLGAVSTTHLTSAASLNTPSVSNALRASSAVAASSASHVKTTTSAAAASTRRIEAKTTTASVHASNSARVSGSSEASKDPSVTSANVEVKTSASAGIQKQ